MWLLTADNSGRKLPQFNFHPDGLVFILKCRTFPILNFKINLMARKSRKKKRQEQLNKRDRKKFFTVVAISTVVLLILLYIIYQNA
jgi:hypothetical protein